MKNKVHQAWILLAIIATPLSTASAQSLKALLTSSSLPSSPSSSFSSSSDEGYSVIYPSSSFRKDPLITIREDDADNEQSEGLQKKIFSIKSAWELFDSGDTVVDPETYEKKSSLEVFYQSLDEELHEDPFYHVGRDNSEGKFIYEEQMWDALADTLRKKSKLVRTLHNTAAKAENMVTLKYESDSEVSVRAKPGIEQIGNKEIAILRLGVRFPRSRTEIDSRVSERGIKLRLGKRLSKSAQPSTLSFEYESSKSDSDETKNQWEQISQICLKVPVW